MKRDFSNATTLSIGWDALYRDCLLLAHKLKRLGPFTGIVAVARGGLIPAAIVARELDLRLVDTVCVVSYDGRMRRDEPPRVIKPVAGDGDGWLVVDDLVDSGDTLRCLRHLLPKGHFATIYAKPDGASLVDTWVTAIEQDLWLVFPWDGPARAVRDHTGS
ncbi:MAG TPA: xanthine phosphoribosyltransferase [Rhodospirillaceae bacterium]|nr:xanthine phosphoribosyltransferase [Rhodospirillaceae bacterium]